MKVYLAKFEKNGQVAYKLGHTKYFYPIKRFTGAEYNDQYKIFDHITIVNDINVQHANAMVARQMAQLVESCLQGMYPKNFRLEQYFLTEANAFDGLSGITEMFILEEHQTEEQLLKIFKQVKQRVERVLK